MTSSPPSRKDLIRKLLKGIETGDPESAAVVDDARYKQHNPQTHEGGEGLAALFQRLSKNNPRVNLVRVYEDGDYVFGHTEYDFATRRIGFEVFKFDPMTNQAIEHWDNIQPRAVPELNAAGHSMVDGPTVAHDLDQTEANRSLIKEMVETCLIAGQYDQLKKYMASDLIQHSPLINHDGLAAYQNYLMNASNNNNNLQYVKLHRVLAEGNFVLAACECITDGQATAWYHLFSVATNKKVVEHWDTVETIPPPSEWKNQNGKF